MKLQKGTHRWPSAPRSGGLLSAAERRYVADDREGRLDRDETIRVKRDTV